MHAGQQVPVCRDRTGMNRCLPMLSETTVPGVSQVASHRLNFDLTMGGRVASLSPFHSTFEIEPKLSSPGFEDAPASKTRLEKTRLDQYRF